MARIATRLSGCHLADVMDDPDDLSTAAIRPMCSYCGKKWPEIINPPTNIDYDIELTLRRWKDNDCTVDDMFARLLLEHQRIFASVADHMKTATQKRKPKYTYNFGTMQFEKTKPQTKKVS